MTPVISDQVLKRCSNWKSKSSPRSRTDKKWYQGFVASGRYSIWDKPAMGCLLTRIPHETEVTEGMLRMVEQAENFYLIKGTGSQGQDPWRSRKNRVPAGLFWKMIHKVWQRTNISNLKKIGFRYVALDSKDTDQVVQIRKSIIYDQKRNWKSADRDKKRAESIEECTWRVSEFHLFRPGFCQDRSSRKCAPDILRLSIALVRSNWTGCRDIQGNDGEKHNVIGTGLTKRCLNR